MPKEGNRKSSLLIERMHMITLSRVKKHYDENFKVVKTRKKFLLIAQLQRSIDTESLIQTIAVQTLGASLETNRDGR